MNVYSAVMTALGAGGSLTRIAVYGFGLWLAVRARRENAPGSDRAAAGFLVLVVATMSYATAGVTQSVALMHYGVSVFELIASWVGGLSGLGALLDLAGHGLLIAAFVSAWRAATDPAPPDAPAPPNRSFPPDLSAPSRL